MKTKNEIMHYVPVEAAVAPEKIEQKDEKYGVQWFIRTRDAWKLRLAVQVAAHVVRDAHIIEHPEHPGWRGIRCTPEQFKDIRLKVRAYWKAFKSDLDVFYAAFIQKHRLWANDSRQYGAVELSPEERLRRRMAADIAATLNPHGGGHVAA